MSPALKERIKKWGNRTLSVLLAPCERLLGRFITLHLRPIYACQVLLKADNRDYRDCAIIMQGPLLLRYSFTLETLKLYKKYYPDALLLLSTWEGEDAQTIEAARALGVEVLLNKKPVNPGPDHTNINLQIVSSVAGLKCAEAAGKRYALKTRTDYRLYNPRALSFMSDLLSAFPLPAGVATQKGRLIGTFGSVERFYLFSDMFVFGHTEDVLSFFDVPLPKDDAVLPLSVSPLGDGKVAFRPEQYFFSEFLKKVGHTLSHTHEDSLRAQARHTVQIDWAMLDLYWFKYERHSEYRTRLYRRRDHILYFSDWLALYNRFHT